MLFFGGGGVGRCTEFLGLFEQQKLHVSVILFLTFRRRIKSSLPFAGIIRRLPYSARFQDKG